MSVVEAARLLVAPQVVHSLAFRRAAMGRLSHEGVMPELLGWKRSFERRLWGAGLPFYFVGLASNWARLDLFPGRELAREEWLIAGMAGLDVARVVDLPQLVWGGHLERYAPWLWLLPEPCEAENSAEFSASRV